MGPGAPSPSATDVTGADVSSVAAKSVSSVGCGILAMGNLPTQVSYVALDHGAIDVFQAAARCGAVPRTSDLDVLAGGENVADLDVVNVDADE